MSVSATLLFDRLNQRGASRLERHEVVSPAFEVVRRNLRRIVYELRDTEDQVSADIIDGLRPLLSEWLTVPVAFDGAMSDALKGLFGPSVDVHRIWGREVCAAYEEAVQTADTLSATGSALRKHLGEILKDLVDTGKNFKIYCHRRARPHFLPLLSPHLSRETLETCFLHSAAEYREALPFDVLIKVGPLRSRGWGAAPDAIITAPRFQTLVQVVWRGSLDDEDFGYDPVTEIKHNTEKSEKAPDARYRSLDWVSQVYRTGEKSGIQTDDIDEDVGDDLRFLRDLFESRDYRNATLVQIEEGLGLLYPPRSRVLSFDSSSVAVNPVDHRVPGDSLRPGMFVIQPYLAPIDLGGAWSKGGSYSDTWKERLREEFRANSSRLITDLRREGLHLSNLGSAIEYWCKAPTTVIHAPQQKRHFEILVRVLGLEEPPRAGVPWWERAWYEIGRSRGDAIHSGHIVREVVDEQLLHILSTMGEAIRAKAAQAGAFELSIPPQADIQGRFCFHPIVAIEHGYRVPDAALKVIQELRAVEKWRD